MDNKDRITPEMDSNGATAGNKVGNWVAYIAIGLLALAALLFLYWQFQPTRVLEVRNNPFPVRTIREHPTADGVVILKVDICKHQGIIGRTRTSFVSPSREVFLPVDKEQLPVGCLDQEVPILIPKDLPGDTYKVKFSVRYQINPIKNVTNEFETQQFIVDETAKE